jgi:hypothetical protein
MDKEKLLEKAQETVSTFETENVIAFLKEMTVKSLLDNPAVLILFAVVFFYAVIRKSRFVLLFLFSILSLMLLIHYTLPAAGEPLTASNTLPFALGGLGIGAVIIYFTFIKTE